jgi:uncharacterized protein
MRKKIVIKWCILLIICIIFAAIITLAISYANRASHYNPPAHPRSTLKEPNLTACKKPLFTVLSVDGGGIKGLIPAIILAKLASKTKQATSQIFDLMAGVSTGSLLTSILALPNQQGQPKFTATEVVNLYKNDAKLIFNNSFIHQALTLDGLIGPKYDPQGIDKLTKKYYGKINMNHLLTHVLLVGYDAIQKRIVTFCNWKNCNNMTYAYDVGHVITGTTAIMSYLPSQLFYDKNDKLKHVVNDASIIINNPSALSYLYAKKLCPNAKHYLIFSIGTGKYAPVDGALETRGWGLIQWLPSMLRTTIESETELANVLLNNFANLVNIRTTKNQLPHLIYIRINPMIPPGHGPTNISKENIRFLSKVAQKTITKNKALITCVAKLLRAQSNINTLSRQCVRILKEASEERYSI